MNNNTSVPGRDVTDFSDEVTVANLSSFTHHHLAKLGGDSQTATWVGHHHLDVNCRKRPIGRHFMVNDVNFV